MDSMIPPSKISGLTQGMFVGAIADNFSERIEQKIFHCEIVVDAAKIAEEEKSYQKSPLSQILWMRTEWIICRKWCNPTTIKLKKT